MPVNLMDLYKDENDSNESAGTSGVSGSDVVGESVNSIENSQDSQDSQVSEATVSQDAVAESGDPGLDSDVSDDGVSGAVDLSKSSDETVSVEEADGLTEADKDAYGVTKMPTKIEVEDLEETKSDFLADSTSDSVPDDLAYSPVFESKTVVNYTLAIAGFGLLVLGMFSFLNSQNISIQSSLDVISETGKGSLSASPPGLPNIDLKSALNSGADSGSGSGGSAADSGSGGLIADSGSAAGTSGGTGAGSAANTGGNSNVDGSGSVNSTGDAFGVFGTIDPSIFSGSGSTNNIPGGLGAVTQNPGASVFDAVLTVNNFLLDLIADDSRMAQNSFLSTTDPTVIRAGNIAGNSGPEVYMVLIISLMFAGFLTIKTT